MLGGDPRRILYTVTDRGGYFQNVRRVLEFSPAKIVLSGRRGKVVVEGDALTLGKYAEGDVSVMGAIVLVKREEEPS